MNELIKGNLDTALEGRHKELTILFSDIRGFTTLSEELTAKETAHLLNLYFSAMIPVVFKYHGTLDKLMGDAIMAFFGAPVDLPDHPVRAAETALDMLDTLNDLKKNNPDVKGIEKLQLGIGLNSGGVTVGNLGSDDFVDYTVIGDAVNLASRLEGLTKTYGTKIILSEFCAARIGEHFLIRELDRVRVKGKSEAVSLFELVDYKYKDMADGRRSECIGVFHEGLEHFREQKWDAAADSFQKVLDQYPEDGPSGLYLSRIEKLRCMDLGEDWDCVTVFDHK